MGPLCSQLLNCLFIFSEEIQSCHISTNALSLNHVLNVITSLPPKILAAHKFTKRTNLSLTYFRYTYCFVSSSVLRKGHTVGESNKPKPKSKPKPGRNIQCKTLFQKNWLKIVISALAVSIFLSFIYFFFSFPSEFCVSFLPFSSLERYCHSIITLGFMLKHFVNRERHIYRMIIYF